MNKNGILHKLMLVVILVAGFGLALTLPAYKRHIDRQHARSAVQLLHQLGQSERAFYQQHGFYTADFTQLGTALPCQFAVKDGQSMLQCPGYTVSLEEAQVLRAHSTKYPQWFSWQLESGKMDCEYETKSPVGALICEQVTL